MGIKSSHLKQELRLHEIKYRYYCVSLHSLFVHGKLPLCHQPECTTVKMKGNKWIVTNSSFLPIVFRRMVVHSSPEGVESVIVRFPAHFGVPEESSPVLSHGKPHGVDLFIRVGAEDGQNVGHILDTHPDGELVVGEDVLKGLEDMILGNTNPGKCRGNKA